MMEDRGPRHIRGLVQPKDMSEYLGVPEPTFRVWRKRQQDWIARGRPPSRGLHALLPDPVMDPENPGEPFMVNGAFVYDAEDLKEFRATMGARGRKFGNPNIATLNLKSKGRDRDE